MFNTVYIMHATESCIGLCHIGLYASIKKLKHLYAWLRGAWDSRIESTVESL